MFRQTLRSLVRPAVAQRSAAFALTRTARFPATPLPRALSTTSRLSATQETEGLGPEKLRKLREIEQDILAHANDITADMVTAMLGPPELATKAKQHLQNYSERMTKDLSDTLGCKPEDINRVAQDFATAAQTLQSELDAALKGDPKSLDKFNKDLTTSADQIGTETLELMGFSPKDVKKARDQFTAVTEQIRQEVTQLVKGGKGAIRDQIRAEEAVGLAIARFSHDLQRGVSRHRLDKDAEKVAKSIRLALDPVAREEQQYQSNTMLFLVIGAVLVAGGLYGYKASQPTPKVEEQIGKNLQIAAERAQERAAELSNMAAAVTDEAKQRAAALASTAKDKVVDVKDAAEEQAKKVVGK